MAATSASRWPGWAVKRLISPYIGRLSSRPRRAASRARWSPAGPAAAPPARRAAPRRRPPSSPPARPRASGRRDRPATDPDRQRHQHRQPDDPGPHGAATARLRASITARVSQVTAAIIEWPDGKDEEATSVKCGTRSGRARLKASLPRCERSWPPPTATTHEDGEARLAADHQRARHGDREQRQHGEAAERGEVAHHRLERARADRGAGVGRAAAARGGWRGRRPRCRPPSPRRPARRSPRGRRARAGGRASVRASTRARRGRRRAGGADGRRSASRGEAGAQRRPAPVRPRAWRARTRRRGAMLRAAAGGAA